MNKIKAVVFDVDGTLVDTSEFIFQAYEYALKLHGHEADREKIASQIGKKLEDCYAFLAPEGDQRVLIDAHRLFQETNVELVAAFEYCEEMLKILQQQGLRLALYTSRTKHVEESLEFAGIDPNIFEVIINGEMVAKGKPDPEGMHLIVEKMKLRPEKVAMIGDVGVDILLGKNAGVAMTVGITHGFGTRQELEIAQPDYIIDSLSELPAVFTGARK